MSSQLVYGDGLEDIKDFMLGAVNGYVNLTVLKIYQTGSLSPPSHIAPYSTLSAGTYPHPLSWILTPPSKLASNPTLSARI